MAAGIATLVIWYWAFLMGQASCDGKVAALRGDNDATQARLLAELRNELSKEEALLGRVHAQESIISQLQGGPAAAAAAGLNTPAPGLSQPRAMQAATPAVAAAAVVPTPSVPLPVPAAPAAPAAPVAPAPAPTTAVAPPPAPAAGSSNPFDAAATAPAATPAAAGLFTPPPVSDSRAANGGAAGAAAAAAAAAPPASAVPQDGGALPGAGGAPVLPPLRGDTGMLVICYNRPQYLRRTLEAVEKYLPTDGSVRVVVSQDGNDQSVSSVAGEFKTKGVVSAHMHHEKKRQGGDDGVGYHALARHFGWALDRMFNGPDHFFERVIIVEDDLEIAPDFFGYMMATAAILDADTTVMAVSAYSDLGQAQFVENPYQLHRSDFFPGLGWMINKRVWTELGPKWPIGYWDDWLREPPQRQGRTIIRPEVSRTRTFGEHGVSQSQFYSSYLANIKLNDVPVDWAAQDLRYLLKGNWDAVFFDAVARAEPTTLDAAKSLSCASYDDKSYRMEYTTFDERARRPNAYPHIAKTMGWIMDVKANVPRTAYGGVVTVHIGHCRLFIAPPEPTAPGV